MASFFLLTAAPTSPPAAAPPRPRIPPPPAAAGAWAPRVVLRPPPPPAPAGGPQLLRRGAAAAAAARSHRVTIEHAGEARTLEVAEGETILARALEEGIEAPHDCKLGVCMTCPARLVSGTVDQGDGMLSDDVVERGYALLCVSYPLSDCVVRTIPEEELLSLQLATAND